MNARDVIKALEARHAKDVTMAELTVDNGRYRRIDFWAMPKTWSPITTWGYEVKVSRQDFQNDDKWPVYREYVHLFAFACPWGMIQPDELPDGVGLFWVNKGGKCVRKKHAVRQEPEEAKFRECLIRNCWGYMGSHPTDGMDRLQRAEWHRRRIEARDIGRNLSDIIGYQRAQVIKKERAARQAVEYKIEQWERVAKWCEENGIDIGSGWSPRGSLSKQLDMLKAGISRDDLQFLRELNSNTERLLEQMEPLT